MWWLLLDPEDYGKALVVSFILIVIIGIGMFIYYLKHPEEWKECDNTQPKTEQKIIQYDTISKNDSIIVLKLK